MVQREINRGRHTDHPAERHSIRTNQCPPPPSPIFFTGRMTFLPPNQQRQSTEGLYDVNGFKEAVMPHHSELRYLLTYVQQWRTDEAHGTNLTTAMWPFLAARWRLDVLDKPVVTSVSPAISRRWQRPSASPNSAATTCTNDQPPTLSVSVTYVHTSNSQWTRTNNVSNTEHCTAIYHNYQSV